LICFRCGSDVPEGAPQCPNCGQRFAGARKTFTTTTTSFRALEKRRLRAAKVAEKLPFAIGDVVRSRYEVRDLVGRGPLGVVYRVHDQEIEVDVALKVFDPALLEGEDAREAFRRTIRKVRKLSQQNIVRLYDEEQDGDRFYFTMQLLEGLTLRKVIGLRQEKGSRFSAREIEPILGQIAMALSHAHRHTVHGDLKPENVLILPDVLKLTDFGMFEAVPRDRFVAAQEEAGTARYLAPELRAGGAIDPRADIYSLGALFYELLTGQPFGDGAAPPSQVLGMPDEARPGGVDAIVAKATAPEPADRYESA
jgi:serine/threonine protein kinase